ncbi:MAG: neutral zinc metallopeptidase [Mycobacteriales bacterium]|nr:neutral zinc metallopeptidase [Mycobacteriales bacterium]
MDFNDGARLDTSQVRDARGRGRGLAAGGGGISIVGLILFLVLGGDPQSLVQQDPGGSTPGATSDLAERCATGADADRDVDCRVVGVVNSVQAYWTGAFERTNRTYQEADTEIFQGSTTTQGCGSATSAVGPFYCPADATAYLDLGFFESLRDDYGASGGPFAVAYVLAHEYGHHVQNLLGTTEKRQRSRDTGPQSVAVRIELQADCFAGVWAANAVDTGFLARITEADVKDGLSAAAAVGDDRIQEASTGRVDQESWTHGSAEQRQTWFLKGYRGKDPGDCDTFTGRV